MGTEEVQVASSVDGTSFVSKVTGVAARAKDVAKVSETSTKLNVTTGKVEYILPSESKDPQLFYLSNLDQNVAMLVKTVHLFEAKPESTEDPTEVMKTSLARILNYYWPMAGSLTISPEMKLIVNYNNDGACFAEAIADADLKDLGDISRPSEQLAELLYDVPGATNFLDTPLLVVQLTKFRCGGWSLGLSMQHSVLDGIAAFDFMKAWGEVARGIPLSVIPVLDRSCLKARSPPKVEFPHDEFAEIENLSKDDRLNSNEEVVHKFFSFDPEDVNQLKKKAMEGGDIEKCTTFEVLSALVWRARTRALEMEPEQKTRLYFAVNGREKFVPPLPEGYAGNGIVLTFCMTTSTDLIDRPLSHSVKLVQDAIKLIDDKYMRSAIDYFELTRARPALIATVCVTTWSRLLFHTIDYGWGEPVQSGPVTLPEKEVILFLTQGEARKTLTVLLGLPRKVMESFEESIKL